MGWLKDAVKTVTGAAQDVAGAAGDAFGDAADAAGDAVDDVQQAFQKAGKQFIDAVQDAGKELQELWDNNMIGIRKLRPQERSILRQVYHNSLPPFDRMLIVSLSGLEGRPFVLPASLAATFLFPVLGTTTAWLLGLAIGPYKSPDHYLMFMGRRGYNNALREDKPKRERGTTLVHEACHVWQGYNQGFTWSYVFEAAYYQVTQGKGAYHYDTPVNDKQWRDYNPEQQGDIVADWFNDGQLESSELFPYIRSNVRPGRPHATTDFTSSTSTPIGAPPSALGRHSPVLGTAKAGVRAGIPALPRRLA